MYTDATVFNQINSPYKISSNKLWYIEEAISEGDWEYKLLLSSVSLFVLTRLFIILCRVNSAPDTILELANTVAYIRNRTSPLCNLIFFSPTIVNILQYKEAQLLLKVDNPTLCLKDSFINPSLVQTRVMFVCQPWNVCNKWLPCFTFILSQCYNVIGQYHLCIYR